MKHEYCCAQSEAAWAAHQRCSSILIAVLASLVKPYDRERVYNRAQERFGQEYADSLRLSVQSMVESIGKEGKYRAKIIRENEWTGD